MRKEYTTSEQDREKDKARYQIRKEKKKESVRKYKKDNADKIKIKNKLYRKQRKENDPLYKLKESTSNLIRMSFKRKNHKKQSKSIDILGCSIEFFKEYIENQFESWMNWDNRGVYKPKGKKTWQIDHIIPLDTAKTEKDIIRLNHYTNLRPLCSKENRDKSNKLL